MNQPAPHNLRRIAVVGGGMAGLAAAHRVRELDADAEVTVFEASDRLGGVVNTVRQDGFLIEASADSFISSPSWAVDLCRRIGFADELISTESSRRQALVVSRGKLHPVPEGFLLMAPERVWPLVRSPILSVRGKLRAACEYFVKARHDGGDESLAAFARRRLGREAFERLVQPLVSGIYTADPEKLSLAATLPRFQEMERRCGGLIRGMRAARRAKDGAAGDRGARYSLFVAPREGMTSLVEAIVRRLSPGIIRLRTPAQRVERSGGKWKLESAGEEPFDAVVVATAAPAAAKLLETVDSALADELAAIEYAGSAVVVLGYDRAQIAHPLDGFGFVVPAIERRRILSASFSSVKFAGRAPEGKVLIRVFLGGALQPGMLDKSDRELERIAHEELRELLGATGTPCLTTTFRWPKTMPQYHLGHVERVGRIKERLAQHPGLALAGNAYEGVGIPQCVRSGEEAAEKATSGALAPGESPGVNEL